MTIDEAIARYKNNAEYERTHGNLQGCLEFRQLAEWLEDYKRLLEQEPKIGHWIEHEKSISTGFRHLRECSCCKCYFDWLMPRNSFCPNCGADMRGEDKE